MPDVHLPHLEDEGETAAGQSPPEAPTAHAGKPSHRSKTLMKIGLEVLLIGTGVFLGLMGEQWRERAHHRELAEGSLRSFRAEIQANHAAIARVKDYHIATLKQLQTYLSSDQPKSVKTFNVPFHGLGPIYYERTAWDLAVATGTLAYVDPQLAFALSRVYTAQQAHADLQLSILQSVLYGRSWTTDFEGYWRSVSYYLADATIMEPALLTQYDQLLPRIDRALGEAPPPKAEPK